MNTTVTCNEYTAILNSETNTVEVFTSNDSATFEWNPETLFIHQPYTEALGVGIYQLRSVVSHMSWLLSKEL